MVEALIGVAVLAGLVILGLVGYSRLRADIAALIAAGKATRDSVDKAHSRLSAHVERVDLLDDRLSDHLLSFHAPEPKKRATRKPALKPVASSAASSPKAAKKAAPKKAAAKPRQRSVS